MNQLLQVPVGLSDQVTMMWDVLTDSKLVAADVIDENVKYKKGLFICVCSKLETALTTF